MQSLPIEMHEHAIHSTITAPHSTTSLSNINLSLFTLLTPCRPKNTTKRNRQQATSMKSLPPKNVTHGLVFATPFIVKMQATNLLLVKQISFVKPEISLVSTENSKHDIFK